jgi:hypothetical protein
VWIQTQTGRIVPILRKQLKDLDQFLPHKSCEVMESGSIAYQDWCHVTRSVAGGCEETGLLVISLQLFRFVLHAPLFLHQSFKNKSLQSAFSYEHCKNLKAETQPSCRR